MGSVQEAVPAAALEGAKESARAGAFGWALDSKAAELAGWCILGLANQAQRLDMCG